MTDEQRQAVLDAIKDLSIEERLDAIQGIVLLIAYQAGVPFDEFDRIERTGRPRVAGLVEATIRTNVRPLLGILAAIQSMAAEARTAIRVAELLIQRDHPTRDHPNDAAPPMRGGPWSRN